MDTDPDDSRDFGPQPLDAILAGLDLDNHVLVTASTEQLTHKQVQKGRKGRRLTANLQRKIAAALNSAIRARGGAEGGREYRAEDLFNYRG